MGYSSRVRKESDTTELLNFHFPCGHPVPREGGTDAAERRAVSRAGAEPVTGGN